MKRNDSVITPQLIACIRIKSLIWPSFLLFSSLQLLCYLYRARKGGRFDRTYLFSSLFFDRMKKKDIKVLQMREVLTGIWMCQSFLSSNDELCFISQIFWNSFTSLIIYLFSFFVVFEQKSFLEMVSHFFDIRGINFKKINFQVKVFFSAHVNI